MMPHLFFYQLVVLGLLWLFIILHYAWPSGGVREGQRPPKPLTPRRKRSNEPKPFLGLTHKPHCTLCEQEAPQHASLRQPLLVREPTNGSGSAKQWRPCTPAMAAGLTDRVWSLREVLLYRVPPWPQPQAL
jgi:hypothetical protein